MWEASRIRQIILALVGIAIAASSLGCGFVATDKPLYRQQEKVFDPKLLGIWAAPASADQPGCVVVIARGEGDQYEFSSWPMASADSSDRLDMDLVPLGKYEYLFPHAPDCSGTVIFPAYRVRVVGRDMRISLLNQPQFVQELKNHPGMLNYTEQTTDLLRPATTQPSATTRRVASSQPTTWPTIDNVVLTDAPEKIRSLLIQHEDDPNWFAEVLVFHRMTPAVRQ